MQGRWTVVGLVTVAALAALACTTLLGIDGDVVERRADAGATDGADTAPTDGAPSDSASTGLVVASTLQDGVLPQSGSVDVAITLTRSGYTSTAALGLRWSIPVELQESVAVSDLATDAGATPPGALVPMVEGQPKSFRLSATALATLGPAVLKVIGEDDERRREQVVVSTITGHIDTSFGKGGVAQLGLGDGGAPGTSFQLAGNVSRDGADLSAIRVGGLVYLTYNDTFARRHLDGGAALPDYPYTDRALRKIAASDAGFLVVGQTLDGGAFAATTATGATYTPALVDAGVGPAQAAVLTAGRGFVFSTENVGNNNSHGTMMRFPEGDIGSAVVTSLGSLAPLAAAEDPDGGVFVAGVTRKNDIAFVQHRFASGAPDTTFGTDGGVSVGGNNSAARTLLRTAGRLILGGTTGAIPSVWSVSLPSGAVDPTFGAQPDGGSALATAVDNGGVRAIVELPSKRLLVAGHARRIGIILRLTESGDIDRSFAPPTGIVRVDLKNDLDIRYLLPLDDGSVLAVGAMEAGSAGTKRDVAFLRLVDVDK